MSQTMDVHETLVFIKKPIEELAGALQAGHSPARFVEGSEVAYVYEGEGPGRTTFGLSADLDAPEGEAWTHLLADNDDPKILAALLKRLNVSPDQLQSATDWAGAPLVDLEPIKGYLSGSVSESMTKRNLVESVERLAGLNKSTAQSVVDAVFSVITSELKRGGDVRLVGFGNFTVSNREASTGRDPKTGAEVKIPARKVPKFSAGKGLKDAIN